MANSHDKYECSIEFINHSGFRFRTGHALVRIHQKQQTTSTTKRNKMMNKYMIVGACAVICLAALAQAQYNTYDSDSNSALIRLLQCLSLDSDENPILAKTELGKLVRNSAKSHNRNNNNINTNQQYQQQLAAATRNLYNRQQPMQYAPTHNRRQYGNAAELNGYGPMMGVGARAGHNNNEANDDDDSNSFGPNYNSNGNSNNNDDDGEGNSADGGAQPMNLNQAASGYPGMGQNDYGANDASGAAGFNFGGASGYGPSADGSEFGPSNDGYSGENRRQKSASSLSGSRNYGGGSDDELAGALQYGPNSAINAGGDGDDEGRAGYAPESQNDNNDSDDE